MTEFAPILSRHAILELEEAAVSARVVNVIGPRQVGKTTLVRDIFQTGKFITLDDAGTLAAINNDAIGQLENLMIGLGDAPLIIDEVQRAPVLALALAIKQIVDRDRRKGQFILTGSSNLFTSAAVADSLAGRIRTLRLWPLSAAECEGAPASRIIDWALQAHPNLADIKAPVQSRADYIARILAGGFPEIRALPIRSRQRLYRGHISAVIDRDVSDVMAVRKGEALTRLVDQLAARTAQELNVSELCRLLQLRRETAENYFDALLSLSYVTRLPAWSAGAPKRDIKNAKWHVVDTGIIGALRRFNEDSFTIGNSPHALGPLLESYVYNELYRAAPFQTEDTRFYHWRTADQREIDIVIEAGNRLIAIEVKASASVGMDDFKSIRWFASQGPAKSHQVVGIVFYMGANTLSFGNGLFALPISALCGHG